MRFTITIVLLFVWGICLPAQQDNKDEFNRLYNYYCRQGLFTNASNLLVEKSYEFFEQKDTLTAYELQLKNCHLTDEHLEEFFQKGLTWEGYFANWYITICWAAWLGKEAESSKELLRILEMISQKEPKLLPFYTSSLRSVLYKYKNDKDNGFVFVLQKALDYIKTVSPSRDIVKQYNDITECFYINRLYNSFDGHVMYSNKMADCDTWFLKNKGYIDSLDITMFKDDVVRYYIQHTDNLYILASTLSAQHRKYEEAINLYFKSIDYLEQVKNLNDTIPVKIAAYYSNIASDYFLLGNMAMSKVYSDKAFPYLINPSNSLDYCSVLSNLSLNFWNLNQAKIAALLKKTEISIRKKTSMPPSCSDYALYMMYNNIDDTLTNIILGRRLEQQYGNSNSAMADVYLYMADAHSKLMHKSKREGDNESEEYEKECFEKYIKKAEDIIAEYKDDLDKYNFTANSLGSLYASMSMHFERLGNLQEAFLYAEKALETRETKSYHDVALISSAIHETNTMHKYLPIYYNSLEQEMEMMMPLIGSIESDQYLIQGSHSIYRIAEWASWNPADSISVSIAYDAALLMKGITLRYNVITPYYEKHPELVNAKRGLDKMRDSIYTIKDENARLIASYQYQIKERDILNVVNHELKNVHWEDISHGLKDDEVCIEFVKYTKNAYNWSEGFQKPHYAAIVLFSNNSTPVFVDLFDEDELMDVYNLQPKSYDTEMGVSLYSKLWGNLAKHIEGKNRVYFSPMGLLNLINIENLVDSTGKTAIEQYNLFRVSTTKNILDRTDCIDISSVASFGGIDYKESHEYAELINATNTRGNWAILQNTISEVYQIKESLNNKGVNVLTYTGKEATEKAFKELEGTQSNIIHVATHGYYIPYSQRTTIPYFVNSENTKNIQDVLFYSGILLSGGQNAWVNYSFELNNDDGILSSYEISKLDFHNVDLVVLSACESGLGDNLYDGIFGLQRAFKKAGVKSILMSLWQIDDKATSEYMTLFYKKLSEGSMIHDAYTSTVLEMKQKYLDPYYWASFILLD